MGIKDERKRIRIIKGNKGLGWERWVLKGGKGRGKDGR